MIVDQMEKEKINIGLRILSRIIAREIIKEQIIDDSYPKILKNNKLSGHVQITNLRELDYNGK